MDNLPDLSPPLSEVKEAPLEIDNDNAEYVFIILKKMIKRLSDDLENNVPVGGSSQELKMFLNIQKNEEKYTLLKLFQIMTKEWDQ